MNASSLSFELVLLHAMGESYESSVFRELGISVTEAARIRQSCSFRVPHDLNSTLTTYIGLLRDPTKTETMTISPKEFVGSFKHYFNLMLWPHLYWVVHENPAGSLWNVGFENQSIPNSMNFIPSMVRTGLWTRSALERLACRHHLHDGWDERVVVRFEFTEYCYEGAFTLGVLQEWRAVPLESSS